MKLSGSIITLALCAFLPTTSAFVAKSPIKAHGASLAAERGHPFADLPTYYGQQKTDSSNFGAESRVSRQSSNPTENRRVRELEQLEKRLEQRLANLEQGEARLSGLGKSYQAFGRDADQTKRMWDRTNAEPVQGGSLKTWSFANHNVECVQVRLQTEGRPLDADIELWQGPDNTPHRMRVYVEDGAIRPFSAVIMTPRGPNTIAIRNLGQLEFPLDAYVVSAGVRRDDGPLSLRMTEKSHRTTTQNRDYNGPRTIQGGALRTYPFDSNVESVGVVLKTDGRPLNARIELLQGPNNNKQVIELYTEDGMDRPFFVVIETPGSGNVVRVVNAATVEFPMTALVEPYLVVDKKPNMQDVVISGDNNSGSRNSMMDQQGQW